MKQHLPPQANEAAINGFNQAHSKFIEAATAAAPKMVEAINQNRIMGVMLKEILQRDHITESCLREWLRTNPNKLAEQEVGWLMNYVRVSNKMQGELKLFADAPKDVIQLTMQSAGLLPEMAPRTEQQVARVITPTVASWKAFTDFRTKIENVFKQADEWDDMTRDSVADGIRKARAFLDECERRMSE